MLRKSANPIVKKHNVINKAGRYSVLFLLCQLKRMVD